MRRAPLRLACAAFAASLLAACGEKPQTADVSARKSDTRAYEGARNPFVAAGWKPGDSASWEDQLQTRVRNQNEYNRSK